MNRLLRASSHSLLVIALVLGGGVALTGLATLGSKPAGAQTVPPWEPDPDSVGGLLFFNSAGQQVSSGSITASPLAAYVEGTSTVRTGDTVATLYGYLPISGEDTSEWEGEQLGESTTFPNASAPAPLKTSNLPVETGNSGDETIATLKSDYPNNGTGAYAKVYQLRLYTNAPHKSQTTVYDSADILISGSTWSVEYTATGGVEITTTSLPNGTKKVAYSATLTATGGGTPYKWSVASGSALPAGLTLGASTGTISGTPTATGTFSFKVKVKAPASGSIPKSKASKTLSITITK